jgi:hypothetical protein
MRSFAAGAANSHYTARIHPPLTTSFADDNCGTLARLIAYLCTLALIANPRHLSLGSIAGCGTGIGQQKRVEPGHPFGPGIRGEPV